MGALDDHCHAQIDNRIWDNPAEADKQTMVGWVQNDNPAWPADPFVWNRKCWATDLDFSGVGTFWNADKTEWFGCALISRRHVWFAAHVKHFVGGETINFIDNDGVTYAATVAGPEIDIGVDGAVVYLTADVPARYTHYRVLPTDYEDYFEHDPADWPSGGNTLKGKPTLFMDQERMVYVGNLIGLHSEGEAVMWRAYLNYPIRRDHYWHELHDGDSSSPKWIVIEDELVLMAVHWTTVSGTFITGNYAAVNAAMNTLQGGNSDYQLDDFPLSAFGMETGSPYMSSPSSPSSPSSCGPNISVVLTPQFQRDYTISEHVGFRLRIDANEACGMNKNCFRYYQKPINLVGQIESVFSGVCSWPDMEELPVGEPEGDTSPAGFRLSYIDLVVDSETIANAIWTLIKEQVDELVQTIKDGETLEVAEAHVAMST